MKKFILITRFNVPSTEWGKVSKEWMEERINIFKTFCLPSVVNQTDKDFEWLIYFDPKTKTKYTKQLKKHNFIHIKRAESQDQFRKRAKKDSKEICECGDTLITGRLDNDDVISKDYVKESKKIKKEGVYRYVKGYQSKLSKEREKLNDIRKVSFVKGPFILCCEKIKNNKTPKTAYHRPHTSWDEYVVNISQDRMWIQVIHGNNQGNEFCQGMPMTKYNSRDMFGIDINDEKTLKEYIAKMKKHIKRRIISINRVKKIYNYYNG